MFKKLFNKKENKGYISIETIIVAAIMLSLLSFFIIRWAWKSQQINDNTLNGMEESIGKIKDPTNDNDSPWFDSTDDSDSLLGQNNNLISKSFELEKALNQNQETTITLEKLTKIKNIKASNGGEVEIVSVEGDEVKIIVKGGTSTESIVISGEYTPYDEKVVTDQTDLNYSDIDGYTGTLSQYVASGEESKSTIVTETKTFNSKDAITDSTEYNIAGYKGTLSKAGEFKETLISGTASTSKTVTEQNSANYSDNEGYKGTLSQYVYSGSAPQVKTATDSITKASNSFADTLNYNDGAYTGTLSKNGVPTSKVISGSAADTQYVTEKTSATYNDGTYSGTLSQYVYSGAYTPVQDKYFNVTGTGGTTWYKENLQTSLAWSDSGYTGNLTLTSQSWTSVPQSVALTVTYTTFTNDYYYPYLNTIDHTSALSTIKSTFGPSNPNGYYFINPTITSSQWIENIQSGSFYHNGTYYPYKRDAYVYILVDGFYATGQYTGYLTKPASDTRVYRYQGYVTKPDTRVYNYTQNYSGTVSTPDTRIYKYQGTVTKPDTRTYEYVQTYTGTVSTPDTRVYKYQGIVSKYELDTREYEHYYQYDVDVEYYQRKK